MTSMSIAAFLFLREENISECFAAPIFGNVLQYGDVWFYVLDSLQDGIENEGSLVSRAQLFAK